MNIDELDFEELKRMLYREINTSHIWPSQMRYIINKLTKGGISELSAIDIANIFEELGFVEKVEPPKRIADEYYDDDLGDWDEFGDDVEGLVYVVPKFKM